MKPNRAVPLLIVAVLAAFCAAGLARVMAILFLHVPLDPNEGWNAYHAAAAMGGTLYPGPQSYMVNNYPPLSFYLVGALGRLLGDMIVAGRIVSLLALTGLAAGIYAAARRMACAHWQAAFAALFFVAGMLVFTDYVGMDDPQLLAHAVAAAGFILLLREPRSTAVLAAAALLFALAFFVKHNVIAMALTMTVWLALRERNSAMRLAIFGLCFLMAGLAVFRLAYGSGLLSHLLSARSYSLEQLWTELKAWLGWGIVPLAGLAVLGVKRWCDPHVRLCAICAGVGLVLGVGFSGGAGVDVNAMFDADIAVALGTALALNRLLDGLRGAVAAAAFAAPVLIAASSGMADTDDWLHPMRDEALQSRTDIVFLAARPGPVLCETLSFCYWAHKPATVDVFNTGQAFETGVRSDAELVRMIEARRFAAIQFDPDSSDPLGDNVRRAMERRYRLDHADDYGAFYVPR
jgi:hypothetical protein